MYAKSLCSSQNVFGFSSSFFLLGRRQRGVCAHTGAALPSTASRAAASHRRVISSSGQPPREEVGRRTGSPRLGVPGGPSRCEFSARRMGRADGPIAAGRERAVGVRLPSAQATAAHRGGQATRTAVTGDGNRPRSGGCAGTRGRPSRARSYPARTRCRSRGRTRTGAGAAGSGSTSFFRLYSIQVSIRSGVNTSPLSRKS